MSDHLITTRAIAGTCSRCGSIVIAGHAEGYPARCDPDAVDLTGEIQALLQGRPTYDLWTCGGRIELVYRNRYRITSRDYTVLVTHACNAAGLVTSIRDPHELTRRKKPPKAQKKPDAQMQLPPANDTPPF